MRLSVVDDCKRRSLPTPDRLFVHIGPSKIACTGVMDMIFRDDECRVRMDHAPANFTTIKHMALNLIRRAPDKNSFCLAAWDDDFLASPTPHDPSTRFPWKLTADR